MYVPARDVRIYSDTIKGLQEMLKGTLDSLAPKKKFSFKSGSALGARKDGGSASTADAEDTTSQPKPQHRRPSLHQGATSLDGHTRQYIIVPSPDPGAVGSSTMANINVCVVNMRPTGMRTHPLASLTLKSIRKSLVICSEVQGPIHLTNITNSIVVVGSRQFRMHDSRDCDVYLHTTSRPIIEHCSGIRFAPLPQQYVTESMREGEVEADQWQHVDDFNWHQIEASPNWSVLEEAERVKHDVWEGIVPTKPGVGVDDVLKMVGVDLSDEPYHEPTSS